MNRGKAIYFFQYLPPWRIDVFNEMAKSYDLTIVFWNSEAEGFTYDREGLLARLDSSIKTIFLKNGINAGTHSIRFGVMKLIRKIQPEVVFSHEFAPISLQCVIAKMAPWNLFKLVITTSDNLSMAKSSSGIKALSRKMILNHCDGAILYSRDVESYYKSLAPCLKTDVCPNIQNPDSLLSFSSAFPQYVKEYKARFGLEGYKTVLFTGRLTHVKGIDLLLDAFAGAIHDGWKLVIVGEGDQEVALRKQAEELSIGEDVVFAGYYSGEALYAWYSFADFYILPSRYEPFGAVVNEALVYGCPVVASKYIGARSFISETNGHIFDPLDRSDFIRALNNAFAEYVAGQSGQRTNLMTVSFEESVNAFSRILL